MLVSHLPQCAFESNAQCTPDATCTCPDTHRRDTGTTSKGLNCWYCVENVTECTSETDRCTEAACRCKQKLVKKETTTTSGVKCWVCLPSPATYCTNEAGKCTSDASCKCYKGETREEITTPEGGSCWSCSGVEKKAKDDKSAVKTVKEVGGQKCGPMPCTSAPNKCTTDSTCECTVAGEVKQARSTVAGEKPCWNCVKVDVAKCSSRATCGTASGMASGESPSKP